MKFFQYQDVPLCLGVSGKSPEYVFAENASISVTQPLQVVRNLDDNILSLSSSSPHNIAAQTVATYNLGPSGGPPMPLSTSIYKIPSGTKVTFPNNKHLLFAEDVHPDGFDYNVNLYSNSAFSLSVEEAQSGYFEPIYRYSSTAPAQGNLDVSFYVNSGNLQNFFNITGISNPSLYPPIDEERITGHLGDFIFDNAYLNSFSFSLSPNNISIARASFNIYGALKENQGISKKYYNTSLYAQKSIPHGMRSKIIGAKKESIDSPISFSYNATTRRTPRFDTGTGNYLSSDALVPTRVIKSNTEITLSIQGERINPNVIPKEFDGKRANISVALKDMGYQNFEDNNVGLLNTFTCSGVVTSQDLEVSSDGYLQGNITIKQNVN